MRTRAVHVLLRATAGASWGIAKAYDSKTQSLKVLAVTSGGPFPYMQLDLGAAAPSITAVRIVARGDNAQYLVQSQNLNVYLSATTNWNSSSDATLCVANLTFNAIGEVATVLCPFVATTTRFVTVVMDSAINPQTVSYLALHEITPLYDSESAWPQHVCARRMAVMMRWLSLSHGMRSYLAIGSAR